MAAIANIYTYISSLSKTMYDKCWWIDKLSPEIDTIVDFGCASGELAMMTDRIAPGRFKYIGIDNSHEMLEIARRSLDIYPGTVNAEFYSSLDEATGSYNPDTTILVLNSVLHEVFSYLNQEEQHKLLDGLFSDFKMIAIRDMHMPKPPVHLKKYLRVIENSSYADQWREFHNICQTRSKAFKNLNIQIHEFLLKYRYRANWKRESTEQYLWNWTFRLNVAGFIGVSGSEWYNITYINNFFIPFLYERVFEDFGIVWNTVTHRKMLLKRN